MEVAMVLAVLESRWADTAKFTNVIVAGFRKCRDLVREGKVFIEDKAKVASRVGCSERRIVNFRKLLFKSDKKKLSFRKVESKKVCSQLYKIHDSSPTTTDCARNLALFSMNILPS